MYVYLLHNKNEALDAFKVFKAACGKLLGWIRLLLGRVHGLGWIRLHVEVFNSPKNSSL